MSKRYSEPPQMILNTNKDYAAVITTAKGEVTLRLYAQACPVIVNNFVFLSRANFYDAHKIHRVIEETFVQMGDPTGTGRVGAGYKVADERSALDIAHERGSVSMANSGTNTNSSQFFIVLADDVPDLDGRYCVFGHVETGMDIVDSWAVGDVIDSIRIIEQ